MKKKVLALSAAITMILGTGGVFPKAKLDFSSLISVYSWETNEGYEYEVINRDTICITGYSGYDAEIIIPDKIDGKKVTSLGENSFRYTGIKSITIPDGVKSIGENAFDNCEYLTSITIPESVEKIEGYTFWGCDNLESITLPNSITSIGQCAFGGCKSLTSITIPYSVTNIGDYALGYKMLLRFDEYEKLPNFKIYCYKDAQHITLSTLKNTEIQHFFKC
ncbi:leucine-rich repeat domain-containing protein [Ruminococcus albus]|uniref:Leucine rich repeat-containing protein n=1 Tax=Ruminococcus albus (strain ATCC 27210 / DSM 20455 / JCM 14654 / NCDO 2250 / 7) TaxID=697329 RepID=E6UJW7_RUMA7|nr:leucine-rich repeat domain-containing protein [Ruminococcus albus]ADU23963.1 hypothetical protein Rumal_3518 [Ruminococcus albus 7 = DSM 20455]